MAEQLPPLQVYKNIGLGDEGGIKITRNFLRFFLEQIKFWRQMTKASFSDKNSRILKSAKNKDAQTKSYHICTFYPSRMLLLYGIIFF